MNDPNRDNCIRDSIQELLPFLRENDPDFDLPIIDPYTHDGLNFMFKNDKTGYIVVSNVTNIKAVGLSRAKIRSVKSKFCDREMKLRFEFFVRDFTTTGNYSSTVTLAALKFNSQGSFKIAMKDVYFNLTIKGKLEKINGEEFMKVYYLNFIPEANDIKLHFSKLSPFPSLSKFVSYILKNKV